jgi:hypothetical protein
MAEKRGKMGTNKEIMKSLTGVVKPQLIAFRLDVLCLKPNAKK